MDTGQEVQRNTVILVSCHASLFFRNSMQFDKVIFIPWTQGEEGTSSDRVPDRQPPCMRGAALFVPRG